MTIVINLGLHGGRISGIFITGIFGNFYTKRGEFLTFKTGIPGGLAARRRKSECKINLGCQNSSCSNGTSTEKVSWGYFHQPGSFDSNTLTFRPNLKFPVFHNLFSPNVGWVVVDN